MLLIHSPTNEHLGYFPILAIVNTLHEMIVIWHRDGLQQLADSYSNVLVCFLSICISHFCFSTPCLSIAFSSLGTQAQKE